MIKNILKIELISLFALTVFSFATFYYGNSLPDNSFTITSNNSGNILSYYLFSMVTYASYFSGPWIVVPFFIFAFCYSFIYDKREFLVDSLNVVSLIFFTSALCFFTYPEALGRGLFFFFSNYFDTLWLSLYMMTSVVLFLIGTFRASFKEYMFAAFKALKAVPSKVSAAKDSVALTFQKGKEDNIPTAIDVKKRVASMLKDDESNKPKKSLRDSLPFGKNSSGNVPLIARRNESDESSEPKLEDITAVPVKTTVNKSAVEPDNNTVFTPQDIGTASEGVKPEAKKVTTVKTLNKFADTTRDSQYFNMVTDIAESTKGKASNEPDAEYFEQIISLLEAKLEEFKIEGNIVNVLKGPVVDTFEFRPGAGVKVAKISNVSDDLSLALYGVPIRIVPSMMGKDTVGIEVPRDPREIIYLDEVLNSKDFENSKHALPIAMGKDSYGDPFVIDLASCPHMLVAGATGAGKSVFINALLVSLLVKKSPKKMKLILIDPKQLELALYAKLPHLVMPVITDAKTASISLLWAVQEMERRYSILKEFGVRNLSGFNDKLKEATPAMLANIHQYYEDQGAEDYELPYLVIIVDEFADLILTKAGKEIEQNIARLAAKARAAGIHLVLATQRPSVDVITGVIKSNFPTRISFRVTSNTDSRTILDKIGAERLLGKGDMLYKAGINTRRVHSSFVNESEIEALAQKLEGLPQEFNENAIEFIENGGEVETDEYTYGSHISPSDDKSEDAMYGDALKIVLESRSASASMLQRRLRIGYNRAANLVEEMERKGIVGPAQGAKPRKVLMGGDEMSM